MKVLIIPTAIFLAACGSGHSDVKQAPAPMPKPEITEPSNLPDGYNPDGTIPPASEEEPEDKSPCKIPQASDAGREHGKPPVDRCDS